VSEARKGRGQRGDREDRDHLRLVNAPKQIDGVPTPTNLDAEAAVLSTILIGAAPLADVLDLLLPEHFFSEANGRIYEAMVALHAAGSPIDIVFVKSWLSDRDRLQQAGGAAYIGQLVDATPAPAHVREHAQLVFEKWRLRAGIATQQRGAALGYGDVGTTQEYLDETVAALTALRDMQPAKAEGTTIDTAVQEAADQVTAIERGVSFGLLTGFTEHDRLTGGFKAPDVTLLGAPPKTGKTTLARAMTTNIASVADQDGGRGVIWISLEMTPKEQALCWACTIARVDINRVFNKTAEPDELRELWNAMAWLKTLPIHIFGRRTIRVHEIRRLMREAKAALAKKRATPRLLVIDHLQLLFKNEPPNERRNDAAIIGDITRQIGDIADWSKLPVLLITQLTEDDKGRFKARGSRDIEADCQNFWMLEVFDDKPAPTHPAGRPTTPLEAKLSVKFQRKGGKGESTLWFTPAYTDFAESIYGGGP